MMLNEGVDPMTNATIIPKTVIQEITTASVILSGVGPNENTSITGYGMGWGRFSYKGYDVSLNISEPVVIIYSFST